MKRVKEKSIKMLCDLGKFGIGKSLLFGFYDIPVPEKLRQDSEYKRKKKNFGKLDCQVEINKILNEWRKVKDNSQLKDDRLQYPQTE